MTINQAKSEIEGLGNIKTLVQTYEEIAAIRMRKIRAAVLQNRDFNAGIQEIFQELIASYRTELAILMRKHKVKNIQELNLMPRNGKTVCVLFSANVGLYGDIIRRTYELFKEQIQKQTADIVIIGRLGKVLFEQDFPGRNFTSVDFSDSSVNATTLRNLLEQLVSYEKVFIFFGEFNTIARQDPVMYNLYGNQHVTEDTGKAATRYLFEPSLEHIITFFQSELFASLFEQTLYESQLAKFAARLYTLDTATQNVKERQKKAALSMRLLKHRKGNIKQMDTLSGIALWQT